MGADSHPDAPTLSVVIPLYNNAHVLGACLDSVFAQTQVPTEVIVVDDASTDGSQEVMRSYSQRVILIERDRNGGAGAARNDGLARATSEYIAFLDADDVWTPEFLERTSAFLLAHPTCVAVNTAGRLCRGSNADRDVPALPWPTESAVLEDFFGFWAKHDHVRMGATLMRRETVEAVGGQRAALRTSQDLEFIACLATRGDWGFIPEALWVSHSYEAGRQAGWSRKHRVRWKTCPSVDAWEARIGPLIEPAQAAAFSKVRGRVAAGYAYMMIAGGHWRGARATVNTYGGDMPENRVVKLLRSADRGGVVVWTLVCSLLSLREHSKGWRRA